MDEMFYQIPEILLCHEFFLQQLQARVNEWHDKQKIGDIFVSSVRHWQNKTLMDVHLKLNNTKCGDDFNRPLKLEAKKVYSVNFSLYKSLHCFKNLYLILKISLTCTFSF